MIQSLSFQLILETTTRSRKSKILFFIIRYMKMYFRQYAKGSPYPTTQTVLDSDYDDEDDSDMYDELLGPKVVPIDHNHSIEIIEND